jgi:hypothetical protein
VTLTMSESGARTFSGDSDLDRGWSSTQLRSVD